MNGRTLGLVLPSFFEDHMKVRKGLRPLLVRSCRDVVRMFLKCTAEDTHCRISHPSPRHMARPRVLRFLRFLGKDHRNHIRSRNQRLAALRAFFDSNSRFFLSKDGESSPFCLIGSTTNCNAVYERSRT